MVRKLVFGFLMLASLPAFGNGAGAAYHRHAWIRKDYARFGKAQFSAPCKWAPRKGADRRFLLCPGVAGPVSETIGEFGGVNEYKPWILVTEISYGFAVIYVTKPGSDNAPQGEDSHLSFYACLPVDLLPEGARVHDAYAVNDVFFQIATDWYAVTLNSAK